MKVFSLCACTSLLGNSDVNLDQQKYNAPKPYRYLFAHTIHCVLQIYYEACQLRDSRR